MTPSMQRQEWIEKAVAAFRFHFSSNFYIIPDNVRVSVGIPKGSHGGKKAIGQCWSNLASEDGHFEIFASPELGFRGKPKPGNQATIDMLETIAHELIHATVGIKAGHKGEFKTCALAVGFVGPMTSTPAGEKMAAFIQGLIKQIGEYPAGALNITMRKKKQTYLLKCECTECGYNVRVTAKWLCEGAPICPTDEIPMEVESE